MDKKFCRGCYYFRQCEAKNRCEYFTPITDEADMESVDELIENGREQFRSEWNQYISDNQE